MGRRGIGMNAFKIVFTNALIMLSPMFAVAWFASQVEKRDHARDK